MLHGWIAHGDVAALWITELFCHQANVGGVFAGLNSDTTWQSLAQCAENTFAFQRMASDMCAFGSPFRKRLTRLSVNTPIHMKMARRCDDHDNVF